MADSDSKILGVVILVRHGDRQGFYQSPTTYTPSNTVLTPLGNQQEFQLGTKLRNLYLNEASPSFIAGINTTLVDNSQLRVRADAGGEGGVILNSATSLLQGLFPANLGYKTTLANTTVITGPLGGYQYIPIESVEPTNDISLEGWTSCPTFAVNNNDFYNSTEFHQKATEHAAFLQALPQYLDGRAATLENMWNIFDFMLVQSIHNADFKNQLPPTFLAQARDLANWHEYGIFSSPSPSGIGNIAGHTILPSIIDGFKSIVNESDPVKFVYQAISYKPFLSLFNFTGAAEANPELAGIVDFAAALSLEVRQPSSGGEPVLRFNFKNGTEDEFKTYNFFNVTGPSTDVPLSQFINQMEPLQIDSLTQWCNVCETTTDRGCEALNLAANTSGSHPRISLVGAGFLGAGLTLAVALAVIGLLLFFGLLGCGKKINLKKSETDSIDRKA